MGNIHISIRWIRRSLGLVAVLIGLATPSGPWAQEPDKDACQTVRLADNGWLEAVAINAVAAQLLQALGYKTEVLILSFQGIIGGLERDRLDAFLNYWPSVLDYKQAVPVPPVNIVELASSVESIVIGLAVPKHLVRRGLRSVDDLQRHRSSLGSTIYGPDAGNPIGLVVEEMIDHPRFDLAGFKVEDLPGEQYSQRLVEFARQQRDFVAILAAPSALEFRAELIFLEGQDTWFNPTGRDLAIRILLSRNFLESCENVANLLQRITLKRIEVSAFMAELEEGVAPARLAARLLLARPVWLEQILTGLDDTHGRAVSFTSVRAHLEKAH